MSAIDTAMLSAMRTAIGELLPDTCTILTAGSYTPDGQGGGSTNYGTSATIAFRLDVIQGHEQAAGGAMQPFTSYKGSLPYDTSITNNDLLVHNSVTYAVTNVNTNQSWIAVKRVDLEKT